MYEKPVKDMMANIVPLYDHVLLFYISDPNSAIECSYDVALKQLITSTNDMSNYLRD